MAIEKVMTARCFGGSQIRFKHWSEILNCEMHCSVFLPPNAGNKNLPVLYWLSGLTCTDENFAIKSGAQQYAAKLGIALVMPDTSPRGDTVPDDPDGAWDFGLGAGFYVNATQEPWSKHYQMYDYIVSELPDLIAEQFPVDHQRCSIFGHSMGGHGALTIGLKNPEKFQSISAFSPIVSPINCPWGIKALSHYLGEDRECWKHYDACQLITQAETQLPLLVDQGLADDFLEEQLQTRRLVDSCQQSGYQANIRFQAGYDHSYYFIATFMEEHLGFHAQYLNPKSPV